MAHCPLRLPAAVGTAELPQTNPYCTDPHAETTLSTRRKLVLYGLLGCFTVLLTLGLFIANFCESFVRLTATLFSSPTSSAFSQIPFS